MKLGGAVVLFVGAVTGFAAAEPVVIEELTVVEGPAVALVFSAPLAVEAHALHAPERIYFDLPGTTLARSVPRSLDGTLPLLRVRAAQRDPGTVRVVLDLDREVPFAVDTDGTRVLVRLDAPRAPRVPPPAPATTPRAEPTRAADPAAPASRSRMLFHDYRDFDLPTLAEEPVSAPSKGLPPGHPPVLNHYIGPLVAPPED